jgi:hypothetical protein
MLAGRHGQVGTLQQCGAAESERDITKLEKGRGHEY